MSKLIKAERRLHNGVPTVFVNDKPLSILNGMATKLNDSDELLIFVPISGG